MIISILKILYKSFRYSFMSKDTKLNIHKEIFDKERDLEDDQKIYLREKMIHVYTVYLLMEMRILLF